jgi:hypothetical protein
MLEEDAAVTRTRRIPPSLCVLVEGEAGRDSAAHSPVNIFKNVVTLVVSLCMRPRLERF